MANKSSGCCHLPSVAGFGQQIANRGPKRRRPISGFGPALKMALLSIHP